MISVDLVFRLMHLFIRRQKQRWKEEEEMMPSRGSQTASAKALPSPPLHSNLANAETAHPRVSPLFLGMSVLGF